MRLRRTQARDAGDERGINRLVSRQARPLQMSAPRRLLGNPQDLDRQSAEIRAERARTPGRPKLAMAKKPREEEKDDHWPEALRRRLIAAILGAADLFPHPGEDESERVHESRKALKEARALARLMTGVVGPPAYDALRELESARRRMGRARDLDVMPDALASLGGRLESKLVEALGQAI